MKKCTWTSRSKSLKQRLKTIGCRFLTLIGCRALQSAVTQVQPMTVDNSNLIVLLCSFVIKTAVHNFIVHKKEKNSRENIIWHTYM